VLPIETATKGEKMTVRSLMYGIKEKADGNLPSILHYTGAGLSAVSGLPALPDNPAIGLNLAVGIILGWEGLPDRYSKIIGDYFSSGYNSVVGTLRKALGQKELTHRQAKDYHFSSRYNRLVGGLCGCRRSEKLKGIIAVGLAVLPAGLYMIGQKDAALANTVFDLGVWVSVAGTEIEKRRILEELDAIF